MFSNEPDPSEASLERPVEEGELSYSEKLQVHLELDKLFLRYAPTGRLLEACAVSWGGQIFLALIIRIHPIPSYKKRPFSRSILTSLFTTNCIWFPNQTTMLAAPVEFTLKIVREVNLMAQGKAIRISNRESCCQNTQTLSALYQELGWVENL